MKLNQKPNAKIKAKTPSSSSRANKMPDVLAIPYISIIKFMYKVLTKDRST